MVASSKWLLILRAFQLTLPRAAAGWCFALLTSNFNRIAVVEFGIAAVTITTLLGVYHFLSPFQVIYGRIADRVPIFGYHRTPYIILGFFISAAAVASLPYIVVPMSQTPNDFFFLSFTFAPFVVFFIVLLFFGIGFAMAGSNHLALVAEVIPPRGRGVVTALIWTVLILGVILSLEFIRRYMPVYDQDKMESLYLFSIPIVMTVTILGLIGVEKRSTKPREVAESSNENGVDSSSLWSFIVTAFSNRAVRNFFLFIFLFQMGYSLQETIMEVAGAQVLDMTVGETSRFQQIWGAGAIIGMFMMGGLVFKGALSKRVSITIGVIGIVISLLLVAWGSQTYDRDLIHKALFMMGLFNGFGLVGTLTASMEFTTDKERGAYIGLWGLAIAFATGMASSLAGLQVTLIIESGLLPPNTGFAVIFVGEALLALSCLWFLWNIDHPSLSGNISKDGFNSAMENDMA